MSKILPRFTKTQALAAVASIVVAVSLIGWAHVALQNQRLDKREAQVKVRERTVEKQVRSFERQIVPVPTPIGPSQPVVVTVTLPAPQPSPTTRPPITAPPGPPLTIAPRQPAVSTPPPPITTPVPIPTPATTTPPLLCRVATVVCDLIVAEHPAPKSEGDGWPLVLPLGFMFLGVAAGVVARRRFSHPPAGVDTSP